MRVNVQKTTEDLLWVTRMEAKKETDQVQYEAHYEASPLHGLCRRLKNVIVANNKKSKAKMSGSRSSMC